MSFYVIFKELVCIAKINTLDDKMREYYSFDIPTIYCTFSCHPDEGVIFVLILFFD